MPSEDHNAKWEELQARDNRRYKTHASKLRDPNTQMGTFRALVGKANKKLNKYSDQRKTPEETASDLPQSTSRLEGMERRLKRWTGKGAGVNVQGKEGKGLAPMDRASQLAGLLPQVQALRNRDQGSEPGDGERDAFNEPLDAFMSRHQKAHESAIRSREENQPTALQKDTFEKKFQAFTERSKDRHQRTSQDSASPTEKAAFDEKVAAFMERWGGASDDVKKDGKAPNPFGGKTLSLPGGFKVPDLTGLSGLVKGIHADTEKRGPLPDLDKNKNKGRKDGKSGKAKARPGWRKLPGGFNAPDLGGLQGGLMDLANQIHKDTEASRPETGNQGRQRSNAIVSDESRGLKKQPKQDSSKNKNYRILVSNLDEDDPSKSDSSNLHSGPGPNKAPNPNLLQPPKVHHQPLYSQLSPRGSPLPPNLSNPSGPVGLTGLGGVIGGNPLTGPPLGPPLGPPNAPLLNPITTPQHLMPPPLRLPDPSMPPGGPMKR